MPSSPPNLLTLHFAIAADAGPAGLFDALPAVAITVGGVFLTIATGFVLRRQRIIEDGADATLLKLLVRVLLPALIISRVASSEALNEPGNILWPPVLGFVLVAGGILAAWGLGGLFPKALPPGPPRRTFALSAGMFNYGYITIPLVAALFAGTADEGTLGVLFVFNVGVEAAMWGIGLTVLSGGVAEGWWRRALSPPVLATLAGLAVNLTDQAFAVHDRLTPAAAGALDAIALCVGYLGNAAIPIGLLLTGSTICDDWYQARLRKGVGTVALAGGLRLVTLPVVFLALAVTLPVSGELQRVLVLQAAMPAAVFPIVLARHYRGDVGVALRVVVGTSLLALVTTPAWIVLGLWLIS